MLDFLLGSSKSSQRAVVPVPASPISYASSSEESSEESEQDPVALYRLIPRNNFGTNFACVLFSAVSHYVYGIFFNAYESANSRYDYPNIGSMSFTLAASLYLIRWDLTLPRLPIGMHTWKYSVYKILAVTFLTHILLAQVWQQLVNLTWELTFILKDFIDMLFHNTESFALFNVSSYITMKTARWITYLEGVGILTFVSFRSIVRQEEE